MQLAKNSLKGVAMKSTDPAWDIKREGLLSRQRNGFTLVELLAVIAIIGMLVSLLLPAVQAARESARTNQCKHHMRQHFLAAINYSTSHHDHVPGYGNFSQVIPPGARDPGPHEIRCSPGRSWIVTLLPYLDQQNLWDRWNVSVPWTSPQNQSLSEIPLDVAVCPSDDTSARGGLSYVINSGYADMGKLQAYRNAIAGGGLPTEVQMHAHDMIQFDWNSDGKITAADSTITRDTGMSWVHVGNENFSQRIGTIYDGSSNTILFSENVNAGSRRSWGNPAVSNCAFVYPVYRSRASGANFTNPPTPQGFTGLPNREQNLGEGTPFPSANHRQTINVVTAGGSVHSMSDEIEPRIYRSLLTPAGSKQRFKNFAAELPVGSTSL